MAKRKRLTPARPGYLHAPATDGQLATSATLSGRAPIAQVAGDASANQALNLLSDALATARARGLMLVELPLASVDAEHLVRDRIDHSADEMTALVDSIRARGQQTPIEVVELTSPSQGRTHGLVSGWRRLLALKTLQAETEGDRFDTVKAIVLNTDSAQDAYVSMVEENEIRVNLSFYERARIVQRTLKEGVYPTQKAALQGLFGNVARAKRSKIGSFVTLVEALDGVLEHPAAISEKLGLALARRLTKEPGFRDALLSDLDAAPRLTSADEVSLLSKALSRRADVSLKGNLETHPDHPHAPEAASGKENVTQVTAAVRMLFTPGKNTIELQGSGVDDALMRDLQHWLRQR